MHSDLIELGHMSHVLIPKWLHGLDVDVLEGHTVFASSQGLYTAISHNFGSWHSRRCPLTWTDMALVALMIVAPTPAW